MEYKSPIANDSRPAAHPHPHTVSSSMPIDGGNRKKWALIVICVMLALVGAGVLTLKFISHDGGIKKNQYQAVFLTNGQVYFCKLAEITDKFAQCTDIFYLQVQQNVQPADKNASNDQHVSLAKLGSELHGPEDAMFINRDQILFWENLTDGSKVVTTIHQYQQQQKK